MKFFVEKICETIEKIVETVVKVAEYVCKNVTQTVCSVVCGVVCFLCFWCDCDNVCKNVCDTVTKVVCAWTDVLKTVLQTVYEVVCKYILKAFLTFVEYVIVIIEVLLTWVCKLIDWVISWFLCWSYIGEGLNWVGERFNGSNKYYKVQPVVVADDKGDSEWFVYVFATVKDFYDNAIKFGLSQVDAVEIAKKEFPEIAKKEFSEIATSTNVASVSRGDKKVYILGKNGGLLKVKSIDNSIDGDQSVTYVNVVTGKEEIPLLYYPEKVMEVASRLGSDNFVSSLYTATNSDIEYGNSGPETGSDSWKKNLLLYNHKSNTSTSLDNDNVYSRWAGKGTKIVNGTDTTLDFGTRVDKSGCSVKTNAFIHRVGDFKIYANSEIANSMTCGAGESVDVSNQKFLVGHKSEDDTAITTYFVNKYKDGSSVGCNDLQGYTNVTMRNPQGDLQMCGQAGRSSPLQYFINNTLMMQKIVDNVLQGKGKAGLTRVGETYLHEMGHECGLVHDSDALDCDILSKTGFNRVMHPGESNRRGYSRIQWCMVRDNDHLVSNSTDTERTAIELPVEPNPNIVK